MEIMHIMPSDYSQQGLTAGYGNTTSAVNAIRFQMSFWQHR
jgi:hypothetical protein